MSEFEPRKLKIPNLDALITFYTDNQMEVVADRVQERILKEEVAIRTKPEREENVLETI